MDKYCCFNCPTRDYRQHALDDRCPTCSQPYGFPLSNCPTRIEKYQILKPLNRGFYAATYLAQSGSLGRLVVLKVIPVEIYRFFGKDFKKECEEHLRISRDTEHVVQIRDALDTEVTFAERTLLCHVAELDYAEGPSLAEFSRDDQICTAASIAQIAIDLFRLLRELEDKQCFHNDLHDRNIIIQSLSAGSRRAGAVDERIRAIAVDLGSVRDGSSSGDATHVGDLRFIASHLREFVRKLLRNPDGTSDLEYRLASALDGIAHSLSTEAINQRTPDYSDFIEQIEDAWRRVSSPWTRPPMLRRFKDSYNAQTLHPWYVAQLLVDPNDRWLNSVSTPGPQVITGMRGCGKTMLLRALQFHARLSKYEFEAQGQTLKEATSSGIQRERILGLYVSCTRLLDALGGIPRLCTNRMLDSSLRMHARRFARFAIYANWIRLLCRQHFGNR